MAAGNRHAVRVHPPPGRLMKVIGMSLIVVSLGACPHPAKEVVTLTFLDPEWSHDLTERNVLPDERLQEFTRQTGIRVKHLPAPETALDQLGMARELFRKGSSGPDVSGVDVIWPGSLSVLEPHNLIVDRSLPREQADAQVIAARRLRQILSTRRCRPVALRELQDRQPRS